MDKEQEKKLTAERDKWRAEAEWLAEVTGWLRMLGNSAEGEIQELKMKVKRLTLVSEWVPKLHEGAATELAALKDYIAGAAKGQTPNTGHDGPKEEVMVEKNFGWAIEMLWQGRRVARTGWNGKGMWIELWRELPRAGQPVDPFIVMKTAQGTLQPGWLASQADMLASDWDLVE